MVIELKLIIGNMNPKMMDFIKLNSFTDKIMVINKMCNVKTIKDNVDIIIPFGIIEASGLVSNTQVHLEELLMSVNATSIKYGASINTPILKKISKDYSIPLELIPINKDTRLLL